MKIRFDADLRGADGDLCPVYCEVQLPYVGGQKSLIHMAVPAQHIPDKPPDSPCSISGNNGYFEISMDGVHWRQFPTSAKCTRSLEIVELLHIEKLTIQHPSRNPTKEIRFHLAPISYLRDKSNCVTFSAEAHAEELFIMELPELGSTRFLVEWVTFYNRDETNFGATINAGFSATVTLPADGRVDVDKVVAHFKSSLDVMAVLFRQAISLHGWTHTIDGQTVSTWIAPLDPKITISSREERGHSVVKHQDFLECATKLVHSYAQADVKIRSLVRHLSLAINPYNELREGDHFLLMFTAFERVIEYAWKKDKMPDSPSASTPVLIQHLERIKEAISAEGSEHCSIISSRIEGLIKVVNSPSFQDKLKAFFRIYPTMEYYCSDLWPIAGKPKERGLREIRHALAHGSGSFIPLDVVAVAKWHLGILLERLVFVLLEITLPDGISANSYLLKAGAKGWYERDWWVPLRSKPDQPI